MLTQSQAADQTVIVAIFLGGRVAVIDHGNHATGDIYPSLRADGIGQRRNRRVVDVVIELTDDVVFVVQFRQFAGAQVIAQGQSQHRSEIIRKVEVKVMEQLGVIIVAIFVPDEGRAISQAQIGALHVQRDQQLKFFNNAQAVFLAQAPRFFRGVAHLIDVVVIAQTQTVV